MDTARQMLREGLPIKCVEAVFLALYLTADMEDIDRIPVGFKSCLNGHVHRHIVLLVREKSSGQFGALGLSRRKELAYKELRYDTCSSILSDYKRSYEKWWHEVRLCIAARGCAEVHASALRPPCYGLLAMGCLLWLAMPASLL